MQISRHFVPSTPTPQNKVNINKNISQDLYIYSSFCFWKFKNIWWQTLSLIFFMSKYCDTQDIDDIVHMSLGCGCWLLVAVSSIPLESIFRFSFNVCGSNQVFVHVARNVRWSIFLLLPVIAHIILICSLAFGRKIKQQQQLKAASHSNVEKMECF